MTEECMLCERVAQGGPPGGWTGSTERWAVMGHAFPVPGWLVMMPYRHIESLADLDDAEASELGPVARHLTAALMATTGADRVYSYSLGQTVRHLHLILGVPGGTPETEGGRMLTRILQRDESVADPEQATSQLAAIASWLDAHPFPRT